MPTNLNKSSLRDLGEKTDAQKLEKVADKADTTLNSVEKIAGKVENIMTMLTKFKEMGSQKQDAPVSVAPKIEKGIQTGLNEEVTRLRNTAKIKINSEDLEKQLNDFLDTQDDDKTIKQIKSELAKIKKLGMTEKLINDFVLKNCEVVFK